MTLTNPNPGGYPQGARLPSADVNIVWANQPKAVDGDGGGAYAPTSQIAIAGSGLACTGKFDVTDTTGTVSIGGLTVNTSIIKYPPTPRTILAPLNGMGRPGHWEVSAATKSWQALSLIGSDILFPFSVPDESIVTEVTISILPDLTHVALPAIMPSFSVVRVSKSAVDDLGGVSDTSGTLVEYESFHDVTASSLSIDITDLDIYYYAVRVIAESGANSKTGTFMSGLSITYTYDRGQV